MFVFSPIIRVSMALVIGVLIGMAFWFITRQVSKMPEVKIGGMLTGGEAMVIQQIELLEKKNNRTTLRLNAEKAVFSENRKEIRLTNFTLVSYGDESGEVTITAGDGVLNSGSNDVSAGGGVLVMDQDGKAIYSESLRWSNGDKTLASDSPARIFGSNFLIKGRKLTVDIEQGRARLSGGVTAVFQKN